MKICNPIAILATCFLTTSAERESLRLETALKASNVIMTGRNNLEKAIEHFKTDLRADQPDCFNETYNCKYISFHPKYL